jgi:hypothetical protein
MASRKKAAPASTPKTSKKKQGAAPRTKKNPTTTTKPRRKRKSRKIKVSDYHDNLTTFETVLNLNSVYTKEELNDILNATTLKKIKEDLSAIVAEERQTHREHVPSSKNGSSTTTTSTGSASRRSTKEDDKKSVSSRLLEMLENLLTPGIRSLNPAERDKWRTFIGVEANTRDVAVKPCTKLIEILYFTYIFNTIVDLSIENSMNKTHKTYVKTPEIKLVETFQRMKYDPQRFMMQWPPQSVVHKKRATGSRQQEKALPATTKEKEDQENEKDT